MCKLWIIVFLLFGHSVLAQKKTPFLERAVTMSVNNEPVESALKKIGKAAGFSFSYKSSLIKPYNNISFNVDNAPVREVLDIIFKGEIAYKERGNHIILTKAEKQSFRDSKVINGYVIDESTGARLKNVSVYDPSSMSSAVTDAYGYFQIEIKNPTDEEIRLAINKNTYIDTVVVIPHDWHTTIKVPIRENAKKIGVFADTVGHRLKKFWLNVKQSSGQAANLENISDTLRAKHQFGVFPFVGTNGKLSGNVINDYSFNVFGGYSFGNNKFELGGLFNSSRSDVHGIQLAGLANGVGRNQDGVQLAGWANVVLGTADGFQIAGLGNVNMREKKGGSLAGLLNLDFNGVNGAEVAGLLNLSLANHGGLSSVDKTPALTQVSGLLNVSSYGFHGAQVAGLANLAVDEIKGAQVAGLLNIAPKLVSGLQLSGFMNVAKEVDGVQFGIVNFASRVHGTPIGLISVVAHGYHKFEISSDEIFYTNIAFRTGIRPFYNILTVGAMPQTFEDEKTIWSFGYGVGTAPKLSEKLYLNLDLTSSQIVYGPVEEINLLNKLYLGLDFQLAKSFSISAGVTLNGHVFDKTYEGYPDIFGNYAPSIIYEKDYSNNLRLESWLGGKIGVRFF